MGDVQHSQAPAIALQPATAFIVAAIDKDRRQEVLQQQDEKAGARPPANRQASAAPSAAPSLSATGSSRITAGREDEEDKEVEADVRDYIAEPEQPAQPLPQRAASSFRPSVTAWGLEWGAPGGAASSAVVIDMAWFARLIPEPNPDRAVKSVNWPMLLRTLRQVHSGALWASAALPPPPVSRRPGRP